jgi:DNA processing protein
MALSILEENIIKLKFVPEIGSKTVKSIIREVTDFSLFPLSFELLQPYLRAKQLANLKVALPTLNDELKKVILDLERNNITIISLKDVNYPQALADIYDAPPILFVKGDLNYTYDHSLAVVGTRKASNYGESICRKFMSAFGKHDFTIVSGLALGIDAIAHKEALKSGCKCIGVVGHGLNFAHPFSNRDLYRSILDSNGAIVSEFLPSIEPHPAFFPQRNRIIAGLARGTLIIEAAEKSGSLITANYAIEENRDVYAVPGDIQRLGSAGCNKMIQRSQAKLVLDPNDIIDEYIQRSTSSQVVSVSYKNHQHSFLLNLISQEPLGAEHLSVKTGKDIAEINSILTELELEGIVQLDEQLRWSFTNF